MPRGTGPHRNRGPRHPGVQAVRRRHRAAAAGGPGEGGARARGLGAQGQGGGRHALVPRGQPGARSHCRIVLPLVHFIPGLRTYSVPLNLKRQCDRTLGQPRAAPGRARGPPHGQARGRAHQHGALRQGQHRHRLRRHQGRVISDCHFAAQLNQLIPGFLSYSVAVVLK